MARERDHSFCAWTLMESACDPHSFLLCTCLFCIFLSALPTGHLKSMELVSNRHTSSYQIEVILKLAGNCPRLGEDSSVQATVTRSWRGRPRSGAARCAGCALRTGGGVGSACVQWPRAGAVPARVRARCCGEVCGAGLGWGEEREPEGPLRKKRSGLLPVRTCELEEWERPREEAGTLGAGAAQRKEARLEVQLRRVWRVWPCHR